MNSSRNSSKAPGRHFHKHALHKNVVPVCQLLHASLRCELIVTACTSAGYLSPVHQHNHRRLTYVPGLCPCSTSAAIVRRTLEVGPWSRCKRLRRGKRRGEGTGKEREQTCEQSVVLGCEPAGKHLAWQTWCLCQAQGGEDGDSLIPLA